MLPFLCLLPTVLRRLIHLRRTRLRRATCLLPTTYCLLLFLATPSLSAQGGWAATYGGGVSDCANSVQQTSDGGYIVAGLTDSFGAGKEDILVLKLRADGTVEWQKAYGGVGMDEANSIHETRDGGYIVAGHTRSFGAGDGDFWVLKLGPEGGVEWQKTYGGGGMDEAESIRQTSDGGYIVVGETMSFGAGSYDFWVLKLRPDGTVEWQKTYGGTEWDWAHSIQQTSDGVYIVAGVTCSFGAGDGDFWVLKLGPEGGVEWQKTYGGVSMEGAESIQQTGDGGYIVAGNTDSFGAGGQDFWVLKLGPEGDVEWQKTYGGGGMDKARSIHETRDGGYIVAGETRSFGKRFGVAWALKLRPDGAVEWQKSYGGAPYTVVYSVQPTSNGSSIAAGYISGVGGKLMPPDFWVLKLSPDGSIDPSCDFIRDTSITGKDSTATVKNTSVNPKDSNAVPLDSSAMVQTTDVSAHFRCQSTTAEGQY